MLQRFSQKEFYHQDSPEKGGFFKKGTRKRKKEDILNDVRRMHT
jgi:hypothetical protein